MALKTIVPRLLIGIVSIIAAVPISAIFSNFFIKPNTAEIAFENKTTRVVESVEVQLCAEKQQIKGVEPGKTAVLKFDVQEECHYSIKVFGVRAVARSV